MGSYMSSVGMLCFQEIVGGSDRSILELSFILFCDNLELTLISGDWKMSAPT